MFAGMWSGVCMAATVHEQLAKAHALVRSVVAAVVDGAMVDGDLVVEFHALTDLAGLGCARVVERFAATGPYAAEGYVNAGAWLAAKAHAYPSDARTAVEQVGVLHELPGFDVALGEGRIGMAHIRTLARVVTSEHLELARRDEQVLLDAACKLDPTRFKRLAIQWASLCDDALHDPTATDRIHARRKVRLVAMPDGMWHLEGFLEPLAGEALAAALETLTPPPSPRGSADHGPAAS